MDSNTNTVRTFGEKNSLEVFLVISNNGCFEEGVFKYIPLNNSLQKIHDRDIRLELYASAYEDQYWVLDASLWVVITIKNDLKIIEDEHNENLIGLLKAGMSAENLMLQAVSMGLASGPVGAIDDQSIIEALQLSDEYQPYFVIDIGFLEK